MLRILEVRVDSVSGHTAKIAWTTNEPATSKVNYGEQLAANLYTHETPENETLAFEHAIELADLKPEMIYQFKVTSQSRSGEVATSDNRTFTTLTAEESEREEKPKTESFAALLSPTPQEEAPRLNPYADVLGSYAGPTPSLASSYPYYPSYPSFSSSQPLTVVYPPMYQPPPQQQPRVLAQQAEPASGSTITPTVPTAGAASNFGSSTTDSTALLLIIGIIIGVVLAGIYWRIGQKEATPPNKQAAEQHPKVYEFSLGG